MRQGRCVVIEVDDVSFEVDLIPPEINDSFLPLPGHQGYTGELVQLWILLRLRQKNDYILLCQELGTRRWRRELLDRGQEIYAAPFKRVAQIEERLIPG